MNDKHIYGSVWPGLKSYTEADSALFFGRDADIERLVDAIEYEDVCTVYGKSGAGKSSLLMAGVFPRLRKNGFLPVWIRLNHAGKTSTTRQIVDAVERSAKDYFVEIEETCAAFAKGREETLWEWFHRHSFKNAFGRALEPVIVIDQFEEVFTAEGNDKKKFFTELANLGENTIPTMVEDAETELPYGLNAEKRGYRIVCSIREDFFPRFEEATAPYGAFRQNRICIGPFEREQAKEAITKPGKEIVDDVVAEAILDVLQGKSSLIEPALLSVFCSRLDMKRQQVGAQKIDKESVEVGENDILSGFYRDAMSGVAKRTVELLESHLLSPSGFRAPWAIEEAEKAGVKREELRKLVGERLLQVFRRDGDEFIEYSHDIVVRTVRKKKIEEERRSANLKKYKAKHNILTLAGRQLMDNCGFDFSEDNSRTIISGNSKNQLKKNISTIHPREYDGSDNVFIADLLNQIVGNDRLFMHFGEESPTKDGYKALEINTQLLNSQRLINGVVFHGSIACNLPICSAEGFYGINIDYDSEGNEKARIYIHSEDGVNVSGVSRYEIVEYDDYGFPRKILFKDEKNNPCKHFDGNYGIEFTYDRDGNEQYRRYLDIDGENSCKIYNQICGMKSEYDDRDRVRVVLQYFVDEKGEITDDAYGHVGVKYFYDKETGDKIKMEYVGKDKKTCLSQYKYSIVTFHYKNGKLFQLRHYDGGKPVNRIDGDLRYSILEIVGYDKCDRILGYILRDTDEELILKLLYTYDNIGRMTDIKYYAGEDICSISPTGVHHTKYEYYENGLLKSQSHFGVNGSAVEDINGIHRVNFEYDEHGRIAQRHFFKPNEDKYNSTFYEYKSDAQCIVRDRTYIDAEGNYLEEKQELIINHKLQAKEVIFGENNSFIPGRSVKVKFKYNISGDVIEQRFFDVESDKPIADEDGDYGIRIESDNVKEESRTLLLDENGNCSKNKHPYAIIARKNMKFNGDECVCESYFEEDYTPVLCESGYHKIIASQPSDGDELNRKVFFFDCQNNPCNCKDGYSKQIFEEEQISSTESKRTVYFLRADDTPVINNGRGFHKREEIVSEKTIATSRSFKDENDHLINVSDGFAKITCKRYDSLWTLFHFPFEDYDVICFYDENDQKVDVDYEINIKGRLRTFHAHEFIAPLDHDSPFFEVNAASGKNLYRDWTKMWKCVVPLVIIVGFPIYCLYHFFKKLFKIRPNQEKTFPIIMISEVFDEVPKGKAQTGNDALISPAKTMGIKPGCWIIGWNDWLYNKYDADMAERFEKEFNIPGNIKIITLYDPVERIFFNLSIKAENIGLRIQDTQVLEEVVDEMEEKARLLSADENAYLLRTIYLYLAQQYMWNGEYVKAAEYYRKQLALMEKQGEEVSSHALADAYKNLGVCLSCDNKNGEAIEMLERALEILKEREEEKQLIAEIHNHLAQVFRVGGESEKANFHNDRYVDLKKLV
ncbi:MAG: ATP-binding protein [Kiritimatiellae bacterium]|nr:ATP-binding protein [Kiritimatiellia bacterium]